MKINLPPEALKPTRKCSRLRGEPRDFIPKKSPPRTSPPIKEPPRLGPEATSRQSLRNQAAKLLATHEGDDLLDALVDWRQRGN